MVDLALAYTVVIVVAAKDYGFILELRIAAFNHANDVLRSAFAREAVHNRHGGFGIGQRHGLRLQVSINRRLHVLRLLAGSLKQQISHWVVHAEQRNLQFAIIERLRRQAPHLLIGSGNAHHALKV